MHAMNQLKKEQAETCNSGCASYTSIAKNIELQSVHRWEEGTAKVKLISTVQYTVHVHVHMYMYMCIFLEVFLSIVLLDHCTVHVHVHVVYLICHPDCLSVSVTIEVFQQSVGHTSYR